MTTRKKSARKVVSPGRRAALKAWKTRRANEAVNGVVRAINKAAA